MRLSLQGMQRPAVLLSILLLIVLLNPIQSPVIVIANNLIAKGLERQLLECPLPPDSEVIDHISIAGKMEGNGNGMQWFGMLLLRSGMDEDALTKWYVSRVDISDLDMLFATKQETPVIFEYSGYRFKNYPDEGDCYRVELFRNSSVGTESSFWESLLNNHLRGH